MANPFYLTFSSSSPSRWFPVNTMVTPFSGSWYLQFQSTSAGSTANGSFVIEGTMDNPITYGTTGTVGTASSPIPGGGGGLVMPPSSQAPNAFAIAAGIVGNSNATTTTPISAWRINPGGSSGFTVYVTFLQAGAVM